MASIAIGLAQGASSALISTIPVSSLFQVAVVAAAPSVVSYYVRRTLLGGLPNALRGLISYSYSTASSRSVPMLFLVCSKNLVLYGAWASGKLVFRGGTYIIRLTGSATYHAMAALLSSKKEEDIWDEWEMMDYSEFGRKQHSCPDDGDDGSSSSISISPSASSKSLPLSVLGGRDSDEEEQEEEEHKEEEPTNSYEEDEGFVLVPRRKGKEVLELQFGEKDVQALIQSMHEDGAALSAEVHCVETGDTVPISPCEVERLLREELENQNHRMSSAAVVNPSSSLFDGGYEEEREDGVTIVQKCGDEEGSNLEEGKNM
ncbi:hypothetical protein QOT17_014259 [Balamuthia mandrillaris]